MTVSVMSFFLFSLNLQAKDKPKEPEKKSLETKATTSITRQLQKHAFGIGLGQTFLVGQFEDFGNNGLSADFLYTYTASYSFDLLMNLHFSEHTKERRKVSLSGYTMSIKGRSYEFDAFSPFLLGGVGFYSPRIQESNGDKSDSKFSFGFNVGAGADLRLNNHVTIGIMGQFHKPFEIEQDETRDLNGSYAKLLLTCMYVL